MGISWEYHGNIMGISWEYHGNIMGISGKKSVCEKESLEKSLSLLCCETVLIRIFMFIGNAENDRFLDWQLTYVHIYTHTHLLPKSYRVLEVSVCQSLKSCRRKALAQKLSWNPNPNIELPGTAGP